MFQALTPEAPAERSFGRLELPDTPEVRRQVEDGGSVAATFLEVALGILGRLDMRLRGLTGDEQHADEVRFLRDCLIAGPAETMLPCLLVQPDADGKRSLVQEGIKEMYMSKPGMGRPLPGRRRGSHVRGALSAVRVSDSGSVPLGRSPTGLPWMGPPVPVWPSADIGAGSLEKLQSLMTDTFEAWDFDVFALANISEGRPLLFAGWEAMTRSQVFTEFPVNPESMETFLQMAESSYATEIQTSYHNNIHAADVTQTVHSLLNTVGFGRYFDPMDRFVVVLGAIIHDVGHVGRTNGFHVTTEDEIAKKFHDQSVLEHFHLSTAFRLLETGNSNGLLAQLMPEQQAVLRSEVTDAVLGTDPAQHFSRVAGFADHVARLGPNPDWWQIDDSAMFALRSMVLNAADISNQAKPFKLADIWATRWTKECFAQGDAEKRAKIPVSPLCDRTTLDIPGSQIGIISFVVEPTFAAMSRLVPRTQAVCLQNVSMNKQTWERRALSAEDMGHGNGMGEDDLQERLAVKPIFTLDLAPAQSAGNPTVPPAAAIIMDSKVEDPTIEQVTPRLPLSTWQTLQAAVVNMFSCRVGCQEMAI